MSKSNRLTCTVTCADCIKAMSQIGEAVNLVCADPPYGFGAAYDAYKDNLPFSEYMTWTEKWLSACARVLHKHGSLWVFYPNELVSDVDVFVRHTLGLHRRGWITWAYGFGVCCQKNFSRGHANILYYTKTKSRFTFNAAPVRVPSDRTLVYGDKRAAAAGKLPNDVWVLTKSQMDAILPADSDVWYMSRVCGTFHERKKHSPNQIPVALMERIVLACSNPGDLVLDPFSGSASTGVACALHQRNFLGYDISKTCVREGRARIQKTLEVAKV